MNQYQNDFRDAAAEIPSGGKMMPTATKNLMITFIAVVFASWPGWLAAQTDGSPLRGLRAPASPGQQWEPPDLQSYTQVLRKEEPLPIDPAREYDLMDLIDLAQRVNPKTRGAWEQARATAAALGIAQSEYYPTLSLKASGDWVDFPVAVQHNLVISTSEFDFQSLYAGAGLEYVLLDFGRRKADVTAAKEKLMAANLGFNSEHQQVVFSVQTAFYALSAARGKIAVAQSALAAATGVKEATEARLKQGLATAPDLALAQQQVVKAEFALAEATASESDDYVALAERIGISPTTPIRVADFSHLALPTKLEETVEDDIDRALKHRPDLLAKVAALREIEAQVRRARADKYPVLALHADAGAMATRMRLIGADGQPSEWLPANDPTWLLGLSLKFPLFDGGRLRHKLELAEANQAAAEQNVKYSRDVAISQIWKAYTSAKLAFQRLDVARALVAASDKAYQGTFEAYQNGLGSLVDLLAARRELDSSRQVELETRVAVLESSAELAFSSGAIGSRSANRRSTR
jgi:outer membrane protein TolC